MQIKKLFIFSVFFIEICFSQIFTTSNIEDIKNLVDEEMIVFVDLDNCFFQGKQALGHADWFYDLVQEKMSEGYGKEESIKLVYPNWIWTQEICDVELLDDSFISILKKFQKQNIKVMALTHRQPSVYKSTIRQVRSLNFDFDKTAITCPFFHFDSTYPTKYREGIIFVGDHHRKIDVLKSFFESCGYRLKKILFIDDKLKNIEELEALNLDDIQYIGVHYTKIYDTKKIYNRKIADFQQKYYEKNGEIISNEKAINLMNQ